MMTACDRAIGPFASPELARRAFDLLAGKFAKGIAYDKSSARIKDIDGRLHLHDELQHISKACVSPYAGHEIPGFEELGLEPDKIYQLLRDPVELAKAAPTFNGIPLAKYCCARACGTVANSGKRAVQAL